MVTSTVLLLSAPPSFPPSDFSFLGFLFELSTVRYLTCGLVSPPVSSSVNPLSCPIFCVSRFGRGPRLDPLGREGAFLLSWVSWSLGKPIKIQATSASLATYTNVALVPFLSESVTPLRRLASSSFTKRAMSLQMFLLQ